MKKHWVSACICLCILSITGCGLFSSASKNNKKKPSDVVAIDTAAAIFEQGEPYDIKPATAAESYDPTDLPYQPVRTRRNDILDTRLALSFDWSKKHVIGKAHLTIKPYFYPTQKLELDAQSFTIHKVAMMTAKGEQPLTYTYDNKLLTIDLGKIYTAKDTYQIWIDYTARPYEREAGIGQAVTSDRGLFFINADGKEGDKPQQIWTQGETMFNSCWFPTFDDPSEKCTQEIAITVENKFVTISNGKKVSSTPHPDGTRTDVWVQTQPHPVYLFALAVGEFGEYKDTWRGKEVNYYMEKKYAPYAKAIFGNTPEMMEVFSKKLGVDYPWDKYSQIVVRDFVSGAMENTTCTIFFEQMNMDDRQLLDYDNEDIIAHELFHHWFGDLVTCESYANLALNESFASYGEYIWMENKYGKDAADLHIQEDLENYLSEAVGKQVPIFRDHYNHPDDMFDRHSYEKGACVLHTLREYVGDSAFFLSLNRYLTKYAYQNTELANLRMEFEQTTGEDLNWFFNQWFFSAGHPQIFASISQADSTVAVEVHQIQTTPGVPQVFRVFFESTLTDGKNTYTFPVEMNTADTTYTWTVPTKIKGIDLAGGRFFLGEIEIAEPNANQVTGLYKPSAPFPVRLHSITNLANKPLTDETVDVLLKGLNDNSTEIKQLSLIFLDKYEGIRKKQLLKEALRLSRDASARVRKYAFLHFEKESVLEYARSKGLAPQIDSLIDRGIADKSYEVASSTLLILKSWDKARHEAVIKQMAKTESSEVILAYVLFSLMDYNDAEAVQSFFGGLGKLDATTQGFIISSDVGNYLEKLDEKNQALGLTWLMETATNGEVQLRKAALQALRMFKNNETVRAFAQKRLAAESEDEIKWRLEDILK